MKRGFLRQICLALCLASAIFASARKPSMRMGVVAIQDRKGHALGYSALDGKLLSLVKSAGFQAVALKFQPAADLEHTARELGCKYILYTDVVDVHRTTGTQVAAKVGSRRDIWEAEVEFRVFAVDQVQPLLSTSVIGRNAKSHPGKGAPPATVTAAPVSTPAASGAISVSESNLLNEVTPLEETGRQKKHKSVAVASALDREVKMVREKINQPPPLDATKCLIQPNVWHTLNG